MLVAHYPLDEDSGTTAYDHTGNGNDGTVNGATVGATGLLGGTAYSFDGTDDYIDVGTAPYNSTTFSFSSWYYAPTDISNGEWRAIGTDHSSGADYEHRTWYNTTAGDGVMLIIGFGTNGSANSGYGGNFNLGAWNHVAGTVYYDSAAGETTMKIYLNGVLGNSNTVAFQPITPDTGGKIGKWSTSYSRGRFGQVRIYDHVLTPAEVQYLYDVGTTGTILTATKTHGSAISPDLRANVTLNAQAATAYVIGSPATASEEVQSVALSTGTNDYALSWTSTHTDFRVEVVADLSDLTTRVETNRVALLA